MASPETPPKTSRFAALLNAPPSAPLVSTFTPLENCAPLVARPIKRLAAPQVVGVVVELSPQTKHPSWSALAYCPAAKAPWPAVLGEAVLPVVLFCPAAMKEDLPLAVLPMPPATMAWPPLAMLLEPPATVEPLPLA